ncbi:MAG: D-alanine--D-alanine ligase [Candidatus Omnitrophica bacterium]|nr:D-alanine--D-alanine ligase [Candidatus Omnitrophota bacterium]
MEAIKNYDHRSFGKIGVFLGGRSHERPVSLRSGQAVYQALKNAGLDVVKIDTANGFRATLKRNPLDFAFLALHGAGGEDGTVQRILNRKRIPYVGSGVRASALAFDKGRAKRLFQRFNIPTPPFDVMTRTNWKKVIGKWRPPYVIKPVNEGSSIGIFFVETKGGAGKRIQSSFKTYPRLLIEKKIGGREFTVGILGRKALPVIELRPKRKFYDYKAKYTKGLTEYLIPAPIPKKLAMRLQFLARKVHKILGLRDLSRVDFKMDDEGKPLVLEANSIPGFTDTSLLPKAAQEAGLDFTHLCLSLLERALVRSQRLKDNNGKA